MAKKYLITLNDDEQEQLQRYIEMRKELLQYDGIKIKVSETGILKGMITIMLQEVGKG